MQPAQPLAVNLGEDAPVYDRRGGMLNLE